MKISLQNSNLRFLYQNSNQIILSLSYFFFFFGTGPFDDVTTWEKYFYPQTRPLIMFVWSRKQNGKIPAGSKVILVLAQIVTSRISRDDISLLSTLAKRPLFGCSVFECFAVFFRFLFRETIITCYKKPNFNLTYLNRFKGILNLLEEENELLKMCIEITDLGKLKWQWCL